MISVCIATYNGEKYIEEQIASILPQLKENDEIIISDDYSTDKTIQVLTKINSKKIKIFKNQGEKGYTSNFENAIKQAKGNYIFLCDQDDVWLPNKIEVCMQYLLKYDMVISDAIVVDHNMKTIEPSFFAIRNTKHGFINNLIKFSYLGCCLSFRKELLKKILPFPPNHTLCTHDNWISIVALAFYKVKVLNIPLIKYRRHSNNTSSGGIKKTTTLFFKIKYRCYLIYFLLKKI